MKLNWEKGLLVWVGKKPFNGRQNASLNPEKLDHYIDKLKDHLAIVKYHLTFNIMNYKKSLKKP